MGDLLVLRLSHAVFHSILLILMSFNVSAEQSLRISGPRPEKYVSGSGMFLRHSPWGSCHSNHETISERNSKQYNVCISYLLCFCYKQQEVTEKRNVDLQASTFFIEPQHYVYPALVVVVLYASSVSICRK